MKSALGKPAVSGYGEAFARGWERIFGARREAEAAAPAPAADPPAVQPARLPGDAHGEGR